uniref:Uncharacterized protein n=1 Tax=Molossus molossus TaxID=27622 RepID=A0A7J8CRV6_MOLMO|nr:hypothetical protein HJG59_009723 [Molossus molossus]
MGGVLHRAPSAPGGAPRRVSHLVLPSTNCAKSRWPQVDLTGALLSGACWDQLGLRGAGGGVCLQQGSLPSPPGLQSFLLWESWAQLAPAHPRTAWFPGDNGVTANTKGRLLESEECTSLLLPSSLCRKGVQCDRLLMEGQRAPGSRGRKGPACP